MIKLKVILGDSCLEVEGEDVLVKEIYLSFQENLRLVPRQSEATVKEGSNAAASAKERTKRSGPRGAEKHEFLSDLDLMGKGGKETLADFFSKKSPTSALESNAVFVFYLEHILGISKINANHVYTCYKSVGREVPGALRQSLADTERKKHWLNTTDPEDMKITNLGENLVEHKLPKKQKGQ